ncbi:MAG: UDP-N-acetyl-D-glucosamine 2-epimerase, UDP-hydrolysing [Omnitrophica bacterium RIFCSPLOWO2_12_FULL_50_11]|nr:MAG: UDP-N-acetyl-D-glucosamine 2-epimerase, UDP-hydrolysing [Omnitrophica bacterium RIFCSPLOWO2_12_FULL_50_11]
MRTIGVVTVSRSDYGAFVPVLERIREDPELHLHLIASGMHLAPEFGLTVGLIESDGFEVGDRVEMLLSSDTPEGISKSIGLGVIGFAQAFSHLRPDILLVLGDRFETCAAALAALPFNIPIAQIHAGEETRGAMDNVLRHCITRLSHTHFVSNELYAQRVIELGEEAWRVVVSGAPSLDHLDSIELLSASRLEREYGIQLDRPPLLVTYHPVTLEYEQTEWQVNELLCALEASGLPVVFTLPNADTRSRSVIRMVKQFAQDHDFIQIVDNFGSKGYFSMMALALAMVGNSSSGIVEAPSFKLPVVNIGTRQEGRMKAINVIDVGYRRDQILEGIRKAVDPEFRKRLTNLENPYRSGQAARKIVSHLKAMTLDERLIKKHFADLTLRREPVASKDGCNS